MNRREFALRSLQTAAIAAMSATGTASPYTNAPNISSEQRPSFLWGTATAAYQTEGGNVNTDLWLLEHVNAGLFREKSGDACDHYHRYEEDIKLLASLGFNSYRFSIEWARVEPEEGEFSLAQLNHYRSMAEVCRSAGLAPLITLHHFSSPLWFARGGGWERPDASTLFARYCGKVAEHLGDLVEAACTINEINVPAIIQRHSYFNEKARAHFQAAVSSVISSPNFSTFLTADPQAVKKTLIDAHQRGRDAFKTVCPKVQMGMNLAIADDQAVDRGETKLREYQNLCYDSYLEVAGQDDFVAIQTYTRNLVGLEGDRKLAANARKTQMGWEFYPESLEHTIRYTAQRCKRPIIISENGIATENDKERIEYIRVALAGLARCLEDGIDVRGYYHWSAFDNYEWTEGYRPKFGLIAVDRTTFIRTPKPSAAFLGSIAKHGDLKKLN